MFDWFTPPKFPVPKPQPMFKTTYYPPQCNLPEHDTLSVENKNLTNTLELLKNENNTLKLRLSDCENETSLNFLDRSEKIKEIEKLKQEKSNSTIVERLKFIIFIQSAVIILSVMMGLYR